MPSQPQRHTYTTDQRHMVRDQYPVALTWQTPSEQRALDLAKAGKPYAHLQMRTTFRYELNQAVAAGRFG